jgi:hypothetical protein
MHDVRQLIAELDARMLRDCWRLRRWRHFHRVIAVTLSLIVIIAPSVLAVGLISSETIPGKVLLLVIAAVGGFSATFRPYTQSYRRRADMNAVHQIRDEFRTEVLRAEQAQDEAALVDVFGKFAYTYASLFQLRGKELVEATMSVYEQRQVAERETATKPLPNGFDPGNPSIPFN